MSGASPGNVVGTFLSAGITLFLGTYGMIYCLVGPDRARCLVFQIDPSQEPDPTDDEVDKLESDPHLQHFVDGIGEGMPSESE
jgi:hypothetical protein